MHVVYHGDKFNCDTCRCDKNFQSSNLWEIPGVIKTQKCLRKMITQESADFYSLYKHYQNGVMPYSGGLFEQPNAYLEAMDLIDEWSNRESGNNSEA